MANFKIKIGGEQFKINEKVFLFIKGLIIRNQFLEKECFELNMIILQEIQIERPTFH